MKLKVLRQFFRMTAFLAVFAQHKPWLVMQVFVYTIISFNLGVYMSDKAFIENDETHPLNERQVEFLFVVFIYIVYTQLILRMYSYSQFFLTNADAQCGFQNSSYPAYVFYTVWLALAHLSFFSLYIIYPLVFVETLLYYPQRGFSGFHCY